jgi:hypothetical protein
MAAMFSLQFLGRKIDGIWHTGIVVYDREFFFGGGILDAPPVNQAFFSSIIAISNDLFNFFFSKIKGSNTIWKASSKYSVSFSPDQRFSFFFFF